jgi:CheY-like chemotaxis protein
VLDAALRGSEVTTSLLSIAGKRTLSLRMANVQQLVHDAMPLLRSAGGRKLTVKTEFGAGPLMTTVDVGSLTNVLLNLVLNARDAYPDGRGSTDSVRGTVTIVVHNRVVEASLDVRGGVVEPGHYVTIAVADDGPGMPPDVLGRALDPFFTTKPRGVGTGLGLAMAQGFAAQMGGNLHLESVQGAGTTVTVYLPADPIAITDHETKEAHRRETTAASGLLDFGSDPVLDHATEELARFLEVPMVQLCVRGTSGERVVIASHGLPDGPPRDAYYCPVSDHTIASLGRTLEVPDASKDERFAASPMVCESPGVQSFVAAKVELHGVDIGVLMAMDLRPRTLSRSKLHVLKNVAHLISMGIANGLDFSTLQLFSKDLQGVTDRPAPTEAPAPEEKHSASVSFVATGATDGNGLRVLVVDDEADLAETAGRIIEALGHSVALANSADEALVALRRERFDVLMSDILMPGRVDGIELVQICRSEFPSLRCILMSGFADELNAGHLPTREYLEKPYRMADIASLLGRA